MDQDERQWWVQDLEQREKDLLEALQRIDRAGFHQEALLFAFEGGVLTTFRRLIKERA